MKDKHWSEKELEEFLRLDHEPEPPSFLRESILQRIHQRRVSLWQQAWHWLHRPYAVRFKPLQFAAMAAFLFLSFWAGMVVERNREDDSALVANTTLNPRSNYMIGRGLLAGNRVEAALAFLGKAVEQDPTSAEFSYWQGVAYWALGETDLERQSYIRTVRYNPEHLPTHLNLGHNAFENGRYKEALASYQHVLDHDPDVPEALYNKALVYHRLGDESREKQAFRNYLENYRTGKWAWRAVEHLHSLGDHSFRLYRIGVHGVVLNMSELLRPGSASQEREIERLAAALRQSRAAELHIVAYDEDNEKRAQEVALAIRRQLGQQAEIGRNVVIRTSWFGAAESLSEASGQKLSQSVLLFTRQKTTDNGRETT